MAKELKIVILTSVHRLKSYFKCHNFAFENDLSNDNVSLIVTTKPSHDENKI